MQVSAKNPGAANLMAHLQLKFGLMVTNEGFPITGDVTSGNQSDNVWNRKIIDEFHMSFLETWDVAYVADSSLTTEENVRLMDAKKVRFISRLPGRFKLGVAEQTESRSHNDLQGSCT